MASEEPDIVFEADFGDGQYVTFTPAMLDAMPKFIEEEVQKSLAAVAETMVNTLKEEYMRLIRERPRNEGLSLRERVLRAITAGFTRRANSIEVGVFDLGQVERSTAADGEPGRSLFDIMEEGYDASGPFGFVPLNIAVELARSCGEQLGLSPEKKAGLVTYVQEHFQGKHGQGIMVNVFIPLFYAYPDFGTPFEHGFLPHKGWEGWNVLSGVEGGLVGNDGENWVSTLLGKAIKSAGQRLKQLAR